MNFNYTDYFQRRLELCGGALVVKGTRVPVRTLLTNLAEGATEAEVLADFPTLTHDGLRAVTAFAASSAGDDLPVPFAPAVAASKSSSTRICCSSQKTRVRLRVRQLCGNDGEEIPRLADRRRH